MSEMASLKPVMPLGNDTQAQALRRIDAYHAQLELLGLHVDTPIRVLGVLTSGLPGEVLELSLLDETGHLTTHRARPINHIPPTATHIHGLTDDVLCQEWPLARRRTALLTRLRSPDTQGQVVKVIAWAGGFVTQALETSLGGALGVPILSIQDAIAAGDQVLKPEYRYRPSLAGMNWTVPINAPDKASSASSAVTTAHLLKLLFTRQAILHPPPRI